MYNTYMKEPIFNLTPEEQEIEDDIERGEYESVPNLEEEIKRSQEIARNTIELRKLMDSRSKKYNNLTEMLADITPENIHPATDWGPDVGAEIMK